MEKKMDNEIGALKSRRSPRCEWTPEKPSQESGPGGKWFIGQFTKDKNVSSSRGLLVRDEREAAWLIVFHKYFTFNKFLRFSVGLSVHSPSKIIRWTFFVQQSWKIIAFWMSIFALRSNAAFDSEAFISRLRSKAGRLFNTLVNCRIK
jgi:hypothetical protein